MIGIDTCINKIYTILLDVWQGGTASSETANDRSDSGKLHVDSSDTVQLYVAHIEKMKQQLLPVVDLNITKAQKKQKAYYNKRHTS